MARDPKKRQKAIQRKKAKRKQKQAKSKQLSRPGAGTLLRQAGSWPLRDVLLTEGWDQEGTIMQILVARQSNLGQIAVGVFLVDLGCLGVKNAYARLLESHHEYQELRRNMMSRQALIPAELDLVAKIIEAGVAYAGQFGFKPNPDYHQAKLILGEADPHACAVHIPLGGSEGKPFFIAGPYDNADRIMARLTKAVGPDGFNYLVPLSPDAEVLVDDEDWAELETGD